MAEPGTRALPVQEEELRRRLQDIRARHSSADAPVMAEVVRAVLTNVTGELSSQESSLLAEVEELGRMIANARIEIATLEVGDITDSHIPAATDELDAVVEHTAMATDRILEMCERLDNLADQSPDAATVDVLRQATTGIYEACSFQDITGQRITKVIQALKSIDSKVLQILAAFGAGPVTGGDARVGPASEPDNPTLTRGPQLPAAAMAQAEIDRLLASFE